MTFAEIEKLVNAREEYGCDEIFLAFASAMDNANVTVYVEKTVPESEWNNIAIASLECTLSYCKDQEVLSWYRSIGFRW
jgi:hypothetical protein